MFVVYGGRGGSGGVRITRGVWCEALEVEGGTGEEASIV